MRAANASTGRPAAAPPTVREWLRDRPFALALSSGFFGFFAHTGVLEVLEDHGLVPCRISGSSAGALAGGAWASGLDAPQIARVLLALRREDFWDPRPGPGLLSGRLFRARLSATLAAADFGACRVPLCVSTFDLRSWRTHVTRAGSLATAIAASCAVPGLFHPVWMNHAPHVDGGVADRPGLAGVPLGERVFYHHLASRSPWRSLRSMQVPARADMVGLSLIDVPRVGPFRLEAGRRAYERARQATAAALRRRVEPVVHA